MKLFPILVFSIFTACGSQDSTDGTSTAATPNPAALDIKAVSPVFADPVTTFEAEYTDASQVDGKRILAVIILLDASYGVTPEKCTAAYKFKYLTSPWNLEPGKAYTFRACLYDLSSATFSNGVSGTFVAQ